MPGDLLIRSRGSVCDFNFEIRVRIGLRQMRSDFFQRHETMHRELFSGDRRRDAPRAIRGSAATMQKQSGGPPDGLNEIYLLARRHTRTHLTREDDSGKNSADGRSPGRFASPPPWAALAVYPRMRVACCAGLGYVLSMTLSLARCLSLMGRAISSPCLGAGGVFFGRL